MSKLIQLWRSMGSYKMICGSGFFMGSTGFLCDEASTSESRNMSEFILEHPFSSAIMTTCCGALGMIGADLSSSFVSLIVPGFGPIVPTVCVASGIYKIAKYNNVVNKTQQPK